MGRNKDGGEKAERKKGRRGGRMGNGEAQSGGSRERRERVDRGQN